MWPTLAKSAFIIRRTVGSRTIGTAFTLPWPHLPRSLSASSREPPWNKAVGLYLLKGMTKEKGSAEFEVKDFLEGVEESIECYIRALKDVNVELLQEIMHPKLYHKVFHSLLMLPSSSQMLIDVESIRHLKLRGVNLFLGSAKPGDEHKLSYFGQTVVLSQKQLEEIGIDKFDLNMAKDIVEKLTSEELEFVLTVSFSTKEKFAILDDSGKLIEGSNKFTNGFHIWKYGSSVLWNNDYPFEWKLYDINNSLKSNSK